jgi:hypothetical protein
MEAAVYSETLVPVYTNFTLHKIPHSQQAYLSVTLCVGLEVFRSNFGSDIGYLDSGVPHYSHNRSNRVSMCITR